MLERRVVAERLTDVDEAVHVSRPEHKAPTQLKRIFAELVLTMSARLGALSRTRIVAA